MKRETNFKTKIVNGYIVYDLDYCPKIPLRNFTWKSCLFGAANIVKNNDKGKYVYSGYRKAFDEKRSWNLINLTY